MGWLALALGFALAPDLAPRLLQVDCPGERELRIVCDPGGPGPLPSGLTVRDGTRTLDCRAPEPAGPWTVLIVVDRGPNGAAWSDSLASCFRELPKLVPEGSAFAVVEASDGISLGPISQRAPAPPDGIEQPSGGRARLLDAIVESAWRLRGVRGPRAVLVLAGGPDVASFTAPAVAGAWAPLAGTPVFVLEFGAQIDPILSAIADASGGGSAAAARRELAQLPLVSLLAPLRRAVALPCEGAPPEDGSGNWRTVRVERPEADSPLFEGGYFALAGERAVAWEPEVETGARLPPTLVMLRARSGEARNWTLTGSRLHLAPGQYRADLAVRPSVSRTIEVSEGTSPPIAALGAVRVRLPDRWPLGLPLRVASERGGESIGAAWTGEWLPLPPGTYSLALGSGATWDARAVAVAAGTRREIDLSDWCDVTVRLEAADGKPATAPVVLHSEAEERAALTNEALLLRPGEWTATVRTAPEIVLPIGPLAAGESRIVAAPRLGRLLVRLLRSDGSPADLGWSAFTAQGDSLAGVVNAPTDLPAGSYTVTVMVPPATGLAAEIDEGATVELDAGRLVPLVVSLLGADGQPREEKWTLLDADSGERLASGVTGRRMEVLPGLFDVEVWTCPQRVVRGVEVRGSGGQLLHLGALGAISFVASPPARLGVYRDEPGAGMLPATVADAGEQVEVLPGIYVVRLLEPQGREFERTVTVEAGSVVPVILQDQSDEE